MKFILRLVGVSLVLALLATAGVLYGHFFGQGRGDLRSSLEYIWTAAAVVPVVFVIYFLPCLIQMWRKVGVSMADIFTNLLLGWFPPFWFIGLALAIKKGD